MMNVIFGSGIVGLLAKMILGPSWAIVPFYRSRFFSFNPALDDNFIIVDDEIDGFIAELAGGSTPRSFPYRKAWSIQGHLFFEWDEGICNDWLFKIFGNNQPPQSVPYYKNRMGLQVYDLRVNNIYQQLVNIYMNELKEQAQKGSVTEIGDHYYMCGGVRYDFENAISTIPLNALCDFVKSDTKLQAKDIHYLHIRTDDLNFEGANQVLVVDSMFNFFKVTSVAPGRYLMYCHDDIQNPGAYLMSIMRKFDIIDGTSISQALPVGPIPNLSAIEKYGITCVGSYAQWDWCMDIGSCILRLLRYRNRGNKPGNNLKEVKF